MVKKISKENLIPKEIYQYDKKKLETREEVSVSQNGIFGNDNKLILSNATYETGYLIYYIIFFLPLTFKLFKSKKIRISLIYSFLFILMIFSGLRYEIGGDWLTYHDSSLHFFKSTFTYLSLFKARDFLWELSSYISLSIGGGLILHNFLMAVIFYVCLHKFIKNFPYYEIALIISFPIFTLSLQMGYSRQSMSIAFCLLSINALINKKSRQYFFWIIIGTLFHISALFYLILYLTKINFRKIISNNLLKAFLIITLILFSFYFLYNDYFYTLYYYYIGEGSVTMSSSGAIYRCGLNLIVAIIFLFLIFKKVKNKEEQKIYLTLSILSFFFFVLQFKFSTFADRLNFYVAPLQLYTWSYLLLFIKDKKIKIFSLISILSLYLLLIIVWLNFGLSRYSFLPYKNFITSNCYRTDPYPSKFSSLKHSIDKWSYYKIYTDLCNPLDLMNRNLSRSSGNIDLKKLKYFDDLKYFNQKQNKKFFTHKINK